MTTPTNQPSKIRVVSLEMVNDIFQIGLSYAKHKSITAFFVNIFKPRIDGIILNEAKESDMINVMKKIKKKIDPILDQLDDIESLEEAKDLNDPEIHKKVTNLLLKNNIFVPTEEDKLKSLELLKDLNL
jgi:hypothetical protein